MQSIYSTVAGPYEEYRYERKNAFKEASIVFVIDEMIQLEPPVSVHDFSYYKEYKPPNRSNLQPILGIKKNLSTTEEAAEDLNINIDKNTILYGPPGTGKTYNTVNRALEIVDNDFYNNNKDNREALMKQYKSYVKEKRIEFVTFHQSFSYEDFIEGIKPDIENENIVYKVQDGVFKRISELAKSRQQDNYVLIIDEMNRGNVSSIFGELITLIEDDKREGCENELSTCLPYSKGISKGISKGNFTVPKNLYIIGTMNTADKSIEALDTALRRRFTFIEMKPEADTLPDNEIDGINLKKLLTTINNRISVLLGKDCLIGHSYFMDLKDFDALKQTFKKKIIPLLEEYFFNDIEKIGMVLGEGFVTKDEDLSKTTFGKGFKDEGDWERTKIVSHKRCFRHRTRRLY